MIRIATNLHFKPEQWCTLRAFAGVEWFDFNGDVESLASIGEGLTVFYPNDWCDYQRALELCPNLKWLGLISAGYDVAPVAQIKQRGILLTTTRGVVSACIAEDVVLKVLLLARRYTQYFNNSQRRLWVPFAQLDGTMQEVSKTTAAVFGAGSIGTEIARRLKGLDMRVIAYDPYPPKSEFYDDAYTQEAQIPSVLAQADYVICALPLLDSTHDFFNSTRFAQMKPTAYLINIARGGLVDETALAAALQNGQIAGAALDVVKQEPLNSESPLWDVPNLLLTPHQAFLSDRTTPNRTDLAFEMMCRFIRGEPLPNVVR